MSLSLWACGLVGLSLPFFRFPFPFPLSFVAFLLSLWASVPEGEQHREHSGTIGAAGPVVFLVLLGGAWLPCPGPAFGPGFPRGLEDLRT